MSIMGSASAFHPQPSHLFPTSKMANKFHGHSVLTSTENEQKIDDHLVSLLGHLKSDHDDCPVYKNKLQEYAQKSGLPLPVYNNVNEGFPQAPSFQSSVMLDKTKFTSKLTFPDRKAAEQDAAKMAYESTVKDSKSQLKCPHIYQNPIYCKLILHEYAIKTGLGIPKYKTTLAEGPSPLFVSTFVLGGKTYTGEVGRSKKVAEQLVARVAIQSLLGSDSGKLTEIIKSKDKLFTCKDAKKNSGDQGITALSIQKPGSGQFARQQASIQTGILSYNRGNCRVTYPKTKRKVEINKWEENKKKSHGVVANKRL